MTDPSALTQDDLLGLLDPDRNYGPRTYMKVLKEIDAGLLRLLPGNSLPMIFDTQTSKPVKGTGQPPRPDGETVQQFSRRWFMRHFVDDLPEFYQAAKTAAIKGDVRALKLVLELGLGKPDVAHTPGDDSMLERLVEALEHPRERTIEFDE